jgi:hypothetical protein
LRTPKKAIIGGGSAFIDTLDLRLLKLRDYEHILVIGCNDWGEHFKCDIGIMQDSWLFPVKTMKLREKVPVLAIKDYCLHPDIRQLADYLFVSESKEICKVYNGILWCGRTVALGALQLALQLGYSDILCVGFDATKDHSKNWENQSIDEFSSIEIKDFIERIRELQKVFPDAMIRNANPTNELNMPYCNYYEWLDGF